MHKRSEFKQGQPDSRVPDESGILGDQFTSKTVDILLGALGNHEAKCVTLLSMEPNVPYSRGELFRNVMAKQGQHDGWRMNHNGPFDYCKSSLSNIGLVTTEIIDSNLNTVGYVRSPDRGENLGVPFAGSMSAFSSRHPEISLIQLFSMTASPKDSEPQEKKRAPHTRRKIFWEIATASRPITITNLAKAIGESVNITGLHIGELRRQKLICGEVHEPDVNNRIILCRKTR